MNLIPSIRQQPEPSLRRSILGWIMRRANSAPSRLWYTLKTSLVHFYGEEDGFDLQEVHAPCWECHGTGDDGTCFSCSGDGIHHTTRTILHRYLVGGCLFHQLGSRWYEEDYLHYRERPTFRRLLQSRVTHRPTDPRSARECLGVIFLITGFYRQWWRFVRSLRHDRERPQLRHPQHLIGYWLGRLEMQIIRLRHYIDPAYDPIPF